MSNRNTLKQEFLNASGWGAAHCSVLAADASNRSYDRLFDPQSNRNAVLMNAPFEVGEDVTIFVKITELLLDHGLSPPKILNADMQNGFLLIEDLGDDLFADVCAEKPDLETRLYSAAIDVLVALHQHPAPAELPPYDMAVYTRETGLLTEWYLPHAATDISPNAATELRDLTTKTCAQLDQTKNVSVLRDYHAQNLIWLPDRVGVKNVGLLDYQDALAGHPAYDLASLLEDARRDTSKELQTKMLAEYLQKSGADAATFLRDYAILAAQRNLKIIGIFARLCIRDGKSNYLNLIPRVWGHLQNDLQHPALSDLRAWVDETVPEPTQEILDNLARVKHGA